MPQKPTAKAAQENSQFSDKEALEMNQLRLQGLGYGALAKKFNVAPWEVGLRIKKARAFLRKQNPSA